MVDKCYMCIRNREFVDHIFHHCEVACTLWNAIFSSLGCLGLCLIGWLICLLVGGGWGLSECCCVEDGAFFCLF